MLPNDRTSYEFYMGLEIKALQRTVRPRRYSVDRRDEDQSTSQRSSQYLFGRRSLVMSFARHSGCLPILLRSLEYGVYRSIVGVGHIDLPLTGTTEDKAKRQRAIGGYLRSA